MNITHGFFICDEEYLVNAQGLIEYLSEKINKRMECISCGGDFKLPEAVKKHMIDKGHCFMDDSDFY